MAYAERKSGKLTGGCLKLCRRITACGQSAWLGHGAMAGVQNGEGCLMVDNAVDKCPHCGDYVGRYPCCHSPRPRPNARRMWRATLFVG